MDFFFRRRPGYVLLTIVAAEMAIITIIVAAIPVFPFWDTHQQDENQVRLTKISGSLIGAVWLYSICLFLVLEGIKYAVYTLVKIKDDAKETQLQLIKSKTAIRRAMTLSKGITSKPMRMARLNTGSNSNQAFAPPQKATFQPTLRSQSQSSRKMAENLLTSDETSYAT